MAHFEYVIYREIGKTREYYSGMLPYRCSPTCQGARCKHIAKDPKHVNWRDELIQAKFFPRRGVARVVLDALRTKGTTRLKCGRVRFLTPIWDGEQELS